MKEDGEEMIVHLHDFHPSLFMCSLVTVRGFLEKSEANDQFNNTHSLKGTHFICVASSTVSREFKGNPRVTSVVLRDIAHNACDEFLDTALSAARLVHRKLVRGQRVVVFCNMGRNRAALVCLLYCMLYSSVTESAAAIKYIKNQNRPRMRPIMILSNPIFVRCARGEWQKRKRGQ